jgi:hypothetical protein
MKVSTFLQKQTNVVMEESYKQLTDEEKETYLKLKEKVTFTNPVELEYSRLFENKEVSGNIAISIDPIDFLLMSTNKSGWQSCYAISKDLESRNFGEYVSGLFSYMCDPSTTIAYRHSDKMVEYKIGSSKFEAYSKNWRQLIYLDLEHIGMACSKQYPFEDETLSKTVREFMEELLSNHYNLENTWKKVHITSGSRLESMINQISFEGQTLAYNDILHRCVGDFVYNKTLNNLKDMNFVVDSNPICPICGKEKIYFSRPPMCESCYEEF